MSHWSELGLSDPSRQSNWINEQILFGCDWGRDRQPCPVWYNAIHGANGSLGAAFDSHHQHQRLLRHFLSQFCIRSIREHLSGSAQPLIPAGGVLWRLHHFQFFQPDFVQCGPARSSIGSLAEYRSIPHSMSTQCLAGSHYRGAFSACASSLRTRASQLVSCSRNNMTFVVIKMGCRQGTRRAHI